MTGKLLTRANALIAEFAIEAFEALPRVAVWDKRVFVLEEPFVQEFGEHQPEPRYREADAWFMDAKP